MGVSWVILYRSAENTAVSRTEIEKQLETMGAEKSGAFVVDSLLYVPTNVELIGTKAMRQPIHVCHHSEYPSTSFSFIGDSVGFTPHLVSDRSFDQIMSTMQGAYQLKANSTVECKGQKFTLRDFAIFLGDVSISGNSKGLLIQIEFTASIIASSCHGMIQELALSILGSQVGAPQHLLKVKTNQRFSPIDTAIQYVDHFIQFRKNQQLSEMAALQQQQQQQQQSFGGQILSQNQMGNQQGMMTGGGMPTMLSMQIR